MAVGWGDLHQLAPGQAESQQDLLEGAHARVLALYKEITRVSSIFATILATRTFNTRITCKHM